jgi:histidine triad (HIT) family protein
MAACQFCRIVRGEEPAQIVSSSKDVIAFLPLEPVALGHTLIVPKEHVPDLWSADSELRVSLMTAIVDVGRAIENALHPDGMNLIHSAGQAASQTVFHLHMHLVPRWLGDHIGNIWPPSKPWGEEEQNEVADRIRAAFSR